MPEIASDETSHAKHGEFTKLGVTPKLIWVDVAEHGV